MTSTIKPPTDAEIIALNAGEVYFSESPTKYPEAGHGTQYHAGAPGLMGFARAVLARWGAPSPAGEPVLVPCDFCRRCGMAACSPNSNCEVEAECGRNNPAFIQPEAAREPLTDAQIEKLREQTFSTNNPFCPCDSKTMRKAVRAGERAHGITQKEGGQHAE